MLALLPSLSNLSHSCLALSSPKDLPILSNFNGGPHPNFIVFQTHPPFASLRRISYGPSNGIVVTIKVGRISNGRSYPLLVYIELGSNFFFYYY